MKEYLVNGKVIEATLDNDKVVRMSTDFIYNMMDKLGLDEEDAVLTWLEDNEYLINDEQEELNEMAKENKSATKRGAKATIKKPAAKTQKERVAKENPTKEGIIAAIAALLPTIDATDVVIENKGKIITFSMNGENFKIDLTQKRAKKEDK